MEKWNNTSGYYRVHKSKCRDCVQGFVYKYEWRENKKRKSIVSVDLKKLEQKVKKRNLPWHTIDEIKVIQNRTGYANVEIVKSKCATQGYVYRYTYYDENGKRKRISSVSLRKLRDKVKSKGLTWEKLA